MQSVEVRRCPVCGSIEVNLTYVEKRLNGKRYCKCSGCGYEDEIVYFEIVNGRDTDGDTLPYHGVSEVFGEQLVWTFPNVVVDLSEDVFGKPKKKINRPHYKELYEKEKIERAKLQAQFVCLKMINENLSKKDQSEKVAVLMECIDAISKYTSDWYIKNEIKRAREKISKIK